MLLYLTHYGSHEMQAFIERFARTPWLHYWEQRLIGMGFYRQIKSFLKNEEFSARVSEFLKSAAGREFWPVGSRTADMWELTRILKA